MRAKTWFLSAPWRTSWRSVRCCWRTWKAWWSLAETWAQAGCFVKVFQLTIICAQPADNRHKSKFITKILFDISSKEHLKCECLVLTTKQTVCTDIDGHEVAVAQRVHIFKHVALIKYGILQLHLPEETAVIIISNCDVVPNTRKTSKC